MAKKIISEVEKQLRLENQKLKARLNEAEETLNAIRNGEVDAIVVQGTSGDTIYSLTSAETPYRVIIEEMNEGAVILKTEGTILYCNRRFAELLSVPHEQTIGANINRFVPGTEREKFERFLKTGIGKNCSEEISYSTPKGDVRHFYLSFSPLPPSLLGNVCLMISDITELKKTETKLFEEEARFRTIYENAPALIDAFDKDGRCILWNKVCEKTFGWTIEQINSHDDPLSLFYPDPKIRELVITSVISSPEKIFREWNPQTKDGTVLTCMWANFSLPDGTVINLGYDISERKLAEQALKESEQKYRDLVENSPDAIIIYVEGKIAFVNKEALHLMAATRAEELIGKPVMQFVHPGYRELVIARMKKIANNEIVLPLVEEKFVRLDGSEVDVEVKAMSLRIDNKPAVQLIIRDITDRKRAEEGLRKSEEKWRTIFEILPVGISILDKNGNMSEHNPALEKILKLTHDELQEQNYKHRKHFYYENDEMSPDELPSHISIQEQKIIRNMEVGVGEEGGNIIWTQVSAAPLNLPDAICAVVTVDITNHKQLENELRRSELLLNNSQQLTHVGGWEWDVEKQFMYWTNEMYNLFDLDPDKYVPGIPGNFDLHLEGFRPEDRQKIRAAFQRCLEKGESYDMEFLLTTATGRSMWIRMMARPVFKNGKVVRLTGFIMDINERKLFEKELMEREVNYSVLFNTVKQSIYIQKPDSTFITVNQGAVDMYGYDKEYFIGKTPEFLSDPQKNDFKQISEHYRLAFQGRPQKYEFWGKKKDGSIFPKEIWTVKGKYFGEDVLISLAIDITERKRAEAEIQHKNEELLKINAEKDKFFSIIAHDLRGPFSGFIGMTDLLAEGATNISPREFHQIALMMKNSAINLFSLLGNLLEWSLMQRGLTTFDPKSILLRLKIAEYMELNVEAANKKNIAMLFDIPDDLELYADENMLATVIRNLGSNAVKFTPRGGRIEVSARSTSENLVEISIQDTGIGMNKEMIGNLFRLDVNTNRKGTEGEHSTGLGLIICKDFVEKHGGKLWVESEEDKGSIFRFSLPLYLADEPITKSYEN